MANGCIVSNCWVCNELVWEDEWDIYNGELIHEECVNKAKILRRHKMQSCWIINFKNGERVMLSERMYKEKYLPETPKEDVESEEHWFDIRDAQRKNPNLDFIE